MVACSAAEPFFPDEKSGGNEGIDLESGDNPQERGAADTAAEGSAPSRNEEGPDTAEMVSDQAETVAGIDGL